MHRWLALVATLTGCFDFDAAARCFGGGPECPADAGAAGSAPAGDAGATPDGAAGAGGSLCAGLGVQLCEGFEGSALASLWSADRRPAGSIVAIDPSRVFRGAGALHVRTEGVAARGQAVATIQEERTEADAPAERWVRAYVQVPDPPSGFVSLVSLAQVSAPFSAITLGLEDGALAVDDELGDGRSASATRLPQGRWVCLELAVRVGSPGEIRVRLDGQEVEDLRLAQRTAASPPIGDVEIGVAIAAGDVAAAPLEAWYDEIVIDTGETSCTR
jgi:hypothetical protein